MTDNEQYFESEDFQEILRHYEAAIGSGNIIYMDADDLADIADYYQYNGNPEEARYAVELALRFNPDAVGPLLYKAREAMQTGDYATARQFAQHIENLDQREGHYIKGEILICEKKIDEADQHYIEGMKEVADDEMMDYVYDVATIYSDYQLFDKAFEWMLRSQGDDSDDFKELMGQTMFGLGRYKDSERIYNELLDHNPYSTRYWNALANSQYMRQDYGAAITSSEFAIAINPDDAEGTLAKANSLFSLGQYKEALKIFERYSTLMPDDEFGYLSQASCLINLDIIDEAHQRLKKAKECASANSPHLAEILQELAFVCSELGLKDTALYYLEQTETLECDHVNIDVIRGHVLLSAKRYKEAKEAYQQAVTRSNDKEHTMLRIIVSIYDNHYPMAAYHLLKGLLNQAGPEWNEGYSYMALCCLDLKKQKEFMHYLKTATDRNPKEARMVMGDLFPTGTEPKDYYDYMAQQLNHQ